MFSVQCFKRAWNTTRMPSSNLISEDSSGGAEFEPWLVAVILAAIASLVFMIWCKKKFERGTVLREVDVSEEREKHGPHLWDVFIRSDRRGLEGWSWKTIQVHLSSVVMSISLEEIYRGTASFRLRAAQSSDFSFFTRSNNVRSAEDPGNHDNLVRTTEGISALGFQAARRGSRDIRCYRVAFSIASVHEQ